MKLCLYVHEIAVEQLINQFRAWQIVTLWSSDHVKSYQISVIHTLRDNSRQKPEWMFV